MIKHKITDKEKAMVNGGITVEETNEPVIPVGDKYMLTIKEASNYFRTGGSSGRSGPPDTAGR